MRWISMDEELRSIQIERCPMQRTRFYLNGKPYRVNPEKLRELFGLTLVEMNKLYMDMPVKKNLPLSKYKEIYTELERLRTVTIT
jgi:hypothetical protein